MTIVTLLISFNVVLICLYSNIDTQLGGCQNIKGGIKMWCPGLEISPLPTLPEVYSETLFKSIMGCGAVPGTYN